MYLSTSRSADASAGVERRLRSTRRGGRVSGNVVALGAVSLVTDISTEMVNAVLPFYERNVLRFAYVQIGLIGGLYSFAAALLPLVGGACADRWQRRKLLAGVGYGMSAVTKLGYPLAGASAGALGVLVTADRAGKGLRSAPRDALISLSSTPQTLGRSFGVHRMMDTVGAFLGPIVAALVLGFVVTGRDYHAVFVVSFCIGAIGLVVLAAFVRDRRQQLPGRKSVSVRSAAGLLRRRDFRRATIAATLLSLVVLSDTSGFVYLVLTQRFDLSATEYALLPSGMNAAYLLCAVPLGRLADRLGRWRVFLAGQVMLLLTYLLVASPFHSGAVPVLILVSYGVYFAATDGVLMAYVAPMLPTHLRTTGLAVIQTGEGVAQAVAAIAFGFLWNPLGPQGAALLFAGALVVGVAAALFLVPAALRRRPDEPPSVPAQRQAEPSES